VTTVFEGFRDTSAIVTGASSGIGQAIAVALARCGVSRLLVHYRENESGAQQTISDAEAFGCEASMSPGDLSLADDRRRLVDTAFERLGPLQTWVNNAGADVLTGDAQSLSFDSKLGRLIDVDLIGTMLLSRLVAERIGDQETVLPPSIVFIGWDQAPLGMEGDAGQLFGPVKAAVMAFAASLAQSVAPQVRVNTVAPGWIQTAWGQTSSDYWSQRAEDQSLMGRWGTPDDVAKAVLYAADPENTFLTGQTIDVNGGWNRRHT
jgi:3-oxoacyl-[acyl-carrier protein] reductase